MIRTILFPTDFTETTARAERYAELMARSFGARLLVLHIVAPVLLSGLEEDGELKRFSSRLEAKARKKIEAVRRRLAEAGIEAETLVVVGQQYETLARVAREQKADLIVMGTHGVLQEERVYVGTFSHKVFFLSDVPVLFVR